MTTKKAKELIREYESAKSGIELLADQGVSVLNVKIRKAIILADVVHLDYSENSQRRFNRCEYPIKDLEEFHRTRVF